MSRPPRKLGPQPRRIAIWITKALRNRLRTWCYANNMTMGALIEKLVEKYLENPPRGRRGWKWYERRENQPKGEAVMIRPWIPAELHARFRGYCRREFKSGAMICERLIQEHLKGQRVVFRRYADVADGLGKSKRELRQRSKLKRERWRELARYEGRLHAFKRLLIECPFCKAQLGANLFSLQGVGKGCYQCGAVMRSDGWADPPGL